MQNSHAGTRAAKAVSVLLAIIFLWGAGVSLLGVIINFGLGFQDSSSEYETVFLENVTSEHDSDMMNYLQLHTVLSRLSDHSGSKYSMVQNGLETYERRFDPEKTNLRFTFTDMDGKVLLTNEPDSERDTERLATLLHPDTLTLSEKNYSVQQHFELSAENLKHIRSEEMSRYLTNPEDYKLWYFTDNSIDSAYHGGVTANLLYGEYTEILAFDTLRAAQEYGYESIYGDYCKWELVPESERSEAEKSAHMPNPDATSSSGDFLDDSLHTSGNLGSLLGDRDSTAQNAADSGTDSSGQKVLIRVTAYAGLSAENMSLDAYVERKEAGEQIFLEDQNLEQALNKGLDVTIQAANAETIRVYLRTSLPVNLPAADRIRSNYHIFRLLFQYSEQIVIALFVCLALTVIACIWMCSLAGYREPGTLSPSRVHSIAYEWFWLLPPLTVVFSGEGMLALARIPASYRMMSFFGAGFSLCIAACCILWLYTTAVRVKTGTFWNSFFGCRALRGLFGLFRNKASVIIAVIAWLAVVFGINYAAVRHQDEMLLIAAGLDLLTLFGLIYCIYAYFELHRHVIRMETGDFSPAAHALPLGADFARFDRSLNEITERVGEIVAKQTKAEHLRTELITNVSHDLKTPLTSIVNYVDLLSRQEMPTDEAKEYIDVLKRQAARLQKLTLDLVEASKASTGNITAELMPTDVCVLIGQISGEYEDRMAARELSLITSLPDEPVHILADGRLIWRVFDNLLGNACKYALQGTRVYLDMKADAENVDISLKNISATPLNISPDELMERFVRGDSSRHTEGSGLGLSIAKDLTALQNGTITLHTDGDLFKAVLTFPRWFPPVDPGEQLR